MFSLRTLLLVVAVAALGTAALVYRTPYWASAIVTLTLCAFVFGLIRLHSHPEKRRLWVPILIIGWVYMIAAFLEPLEFRAYLPSTRITYELLYDDTLALIVHGDYVPDGAKEGIFHSLLSREYAVVQGLSTDESYAEMTSLRRAWAVSHSLTALILAFGGGAIYSWSVTRRKARA